MNKPDFTKAVIMVIGLPLLCLMGMFMDVIIYSFFGTFGEVVFVIIYTVLVIFFSQKILPF